MGFKLGEFGIRPGDEKTQAIEQFPEPNTLRKVRQFYGLCNFFRDFIPNFASVAAPLSKLTTKDSGYSRGKIPKAAQVSFCKLRDMIIKRPIMRFPDFKKKFRLYTDASLGDGAKEQDGGLGAVLTQFDDRGREYPVSFASRTLKRAERNYSSVLLELTAAEWGIEQFHVYLLNNPFTLVTDCKPLEKIRGRHRRTLSRLEEKMLEYEFDIEVIKGSFNCVADALSRNPIEKCNKEVTMTGTKSQRRYLSCQQFFDGIRADINVIGEETEESEVEEEDAEMDEVGEDDPPLRSILRKSREERVLSKTEELSLDEIRAAQAQDQIVNQAIAIVRRDGRWSKNRDSWLFRAFIDEDEILRIAINDSMGSAPIVLPIV